MTFEDGEPVASTSMESTQPASVNGYRGILPGSVRLGEMDDVKLYGNNNDEVELNGSARTRAFNASAFKKRKLLQSTNLHKISRRAARPWYVIINSSKTLHILFKLTNFQSIL